MWFFVVKEWYQKFIKTVVFFNIKNTKDIFVIDTSVNVAVPYHNMTCRGLPPDHIHP